MTDRDVDSASMEELEAAAAIYDNLEMGAVIMKYLTEIEQKRFSLAETMSRNSDGELNSLPIWVRAVLQGEIEALRELALSRMGHYDNELEAHVRELYGLLDMAQIKHTTWDFIHNSL